LLITFRQLDQVDRNDLTTIDNFKLSERTNVYGTGVILWCMVMNETDPKEPVWTVDPNDDDTLAVQDPGGVYSDKLKDLIRLCLRYYPKDRPTFTEMLDFIEEAMAGPVDLSNGMMAGDALPAARTANMPRFDDDMHAKWSIPSEDGT
jgi:serine/threonine protein kinase